MVILGFTNFESKNLAIKLGFGNFSGVNAIPVQQKAPKKINEDRRDIDMERYQRLVEALLG